jgi:hypothetical protein
VLINKITVKIYFIFYHKFGFLPIYPGGGKDFRVNHLNQILVQLGFLSLLRDRFLSKALSSKL